MQFVRGVLQLTLSFLLGAAVLCYAGYWIAAIFDGFSQSFFSYLAKAVGTFLFGLAAITQFVRGMEKVRGNPSPPSAAEPE